MPRDVDELLGLAKDGIYITGVGVLLNSETGIVRAYAKGEKVSGERVITFRDGGSAEKAFSALRDAIERGVSAWRQDRAPIR